MTEATGVKSFKIGCKTAGDGDHLSYNAMRYATAGAAEAAAKNLYSRWTMMTGYVIEGSDDEPNA